MLWKLGHCERYAGTVAQDFRIYIHPCSQCKKWSKQQKTQQHLIIVRVAFTLIRYEPLSLQNTLHTWRKAMRVGESRAAMIQLVGKSTSKNLWFCMAMISDSFILIPRVLEARLQHPTPAAHRSKRPGVRMSWRDLWNKCFERWQQKPQCGQLPTNCHSHQNTIYLRGIGSIHLNGWRFLFFLQPPPSHMLETPAFATSLKRCDSRIARCNSARFIRRLWVLSYAERWGVWFGVVMYHQKIPSYWSEYVVSPHVLHVSFMCTSSSSFFTFFSVNTILYLTPFLSKDQYRLLLSTDSRCIQFLF